MKVIESSDSARIFSDDLVVHDKLKPGAYTLEFSKMMGWYLAKSKDFSKRDEKTYGESQSKIEKVMRSYDKMNRSLGVLLSGPKGIGKTLFTVNLCSEFIDKGYPVIIIDKAIPGLTNFISNIEQEVVVLFDEFDKNFDKNAPADGAISQDQLLSFFDGINNSKRLFLVTCNELYNVSDYLRGRPGRFHYHFRFNYPTHEEVREYMNDNVEEQYHNQISAVVRLSSQTNLNYDCLRAIAFELNLGTPLSEAVKDLNIEIADQKRELWGVFKNGHMEKLDGVGRIDLDRCSYWDDEADGYVNFNVDKAKVKYNEIEKYFYYDQGAFTVDLHDIEEEDDRKRYKENPIVMLVIKTPKVVNRQVLY